MNGTLSAGDILALSRDKDGNAFDWSWIIGLLVIGGLFGGFGGFGFGGANGAITEEYIANQFTQRDLYNNNTNILDSKYALGTEILENRFNCSQNACNTQKEVLQNRYDNALGVASLEKDILLGQQTILANQAQCCCDLKTAIHSEGETTRALIQNNYIEGLRTALSDAKAEISNRDQSSYILSTMGRWHGYPACGCNTGCTTYTQNLI